MSNPLTADMLTATDQIYLSLWNQICSLDLLPGEKLSEVRLAAEFECSRVPVREALHRLAADGSVDVFPKRGSFVSLIDRQQVEQTRYLREVLETHVCLEAFDSGALTAIYPYLCSIVEQQRTARAMDDIATVFRLDEDFHHIFYSLAHREFVLEHTGPQNVHYRRARLLSIHHEAKETIIEQHTDILEAIRANDRERLQNAIFTHLNNVNVVMQGPNMGDHALYFNPPYEVSK